MAKELSRYRKKPRPNYYSASTKTQAQISLDFETWLLNLPGITKRTLLARLQKSMTMSRTRNARDNLYKQALENIAANAGAVTTELDANLSEFQSFLQTPTLAGTGITEVGMLTSDIGRSYGEALASRNQANNDLIHANVAFSAIDDPDSRKQIQSWIEIITQYIIPD
jgi:hypothetical protein